MDKRTTPVSKKRPRIVCLCGSTRFSRAFQKANLKETLAGRIVLTIGCDIHSDTALFAHLSEQEREQVKARLDALHFEKIRMADEILVLNVEGYVGYSTAREISYAARKGKRIRFLSVEAQQTLKTSAKLPSHLMRTEDAKRYDA